MALRMIAAVGLLCLCFDSTTVAGSYCADSDCGSGAMVEVWCSEGEDLCKTTDCGANGVWCPSETDSTAVAGSYCADFDCEDGSANVWCDESEERCNSLECSNGVWCPDEAATCDTYMCTVGTLKSSPESITGADDATCCDDIDYCSYKCEQGAMTGEIDFCNANEAECTGAFCAGVWCPKTAVVTTEGPVTAETPAPTEAVVTTDAPVTTAETPAPTEAVVTTDAPVTTAETPGSTDAAADADGLNDEEVDENMATRHSASHFVAATAVVVAAFAL